MTTAIVNEAKSPTRGSTPAMIEKLIASGISASATTRPASTSVRATFGASQAGRPGVRSVVVEDMPPSSGRAPSARGSARARACERWCGGAPGAAGGRAWPQVGDDPGGGLLHVDARDNLTLT
ncbi:hypothetical protein GCM10023328_05760 [Modestobacter marinus]|uniref:Uncharacterized protein n=1 Tax=Modestobacter marinus TaxID=477641 RepID=A0ABQ2FT85_9ACTN|nr:hypothetical protein GCM10011589_04200 [Modestobacter marinus]